MSATKKLAYGVATAALAFLAATEAVAQSTGTQAVEQVVVTARRDTVPSIGGVIVRETEPKDRSTITQDYLLQQTPGQTFFQALNVIPGLNFVNNDPYGASGGNLRIHGFDGSRIGLTWDGMPLNDTGNYAIFTSQQGDPEVVSQVQVNLGSTDVDSPTASAAGGLVNYVTRVPATKPGIWLGAAHGSFDFNRFFALLDSGSIGPFGTRAFASFSFQEYDKWRGPGELQRAQFNGRLYQTLGARGDFVSVAAHYNESRNTFYRNLNKADISRYGYELDYSAVYKNPTLTAGTSDFPTPGAFATNIGENINFYGVRNNPSNTGNIRGQSRFTLTEKIRLTVDPFFQYTLANGGGITGLAENDGRLIGKATLTPQTCRIANANGTFTTAQRSGVDLNGDGDVCDTVGVYSPNNTNTRRYGVTSSLIYDLNPTNRFRIAYSLDYGKHRQTGEWSRLNAGFPQSVFGGKDDYGPKIMTADGSFVRGRDRLSIAELNQIAAEYRGSFLSDRLVVLLGLRVPFFRRELNQFCYTLSGSATTVDCNTVSPAVVPITGFTAANYVNPYRREVSYEKPLPNIGANFNFAENQSLYASFAQNLSAPRVDDLYTVVRTTGGTPDQFTTLGVQPETSDSYNLGYRFQSPQLLVQVNGYLNKFQNRIATSFDQDLGFSVSRNVGDVDIAGVDASAAWRPVQDLSLYGSVGYTNAELQDDILFSRVISTVGGVTTTTLNYLPTKGKTLTETPEWTVAGRAEYRIAGFQLGLQAKYVTERFTTDVNDDKSDDYTVVDADVSYALDRFGYPGVRVRANVSNLLDERYLGNINSQTNSAPIPSSRITSFGTPTFSLGAPRSFQISLQARF